MALKPIEVALSAIPAVDGKDVSSIAIGVAVGLLAGGSVRDVDALYAGVIDELSDRYGSEVADEFQRVYEKENGL